VKVLAGNAKLNAEPGVAVWSAIAFVTVGGLLGDYTSAGAANGRNAAIAASARSAARPSNDHQRRSEGE